MAKLNILAKVGAAVVVAGGATAGGAVVYGRKAKAKRAAALSDPGRAASMAYEASPERLARRAQVDREGMAGVYASKPAAYKAAKRAFDVVASAAALVALSPLLAATSAAILLEDGRPVIFTQDRAGKDMRAFRFYKFRSMVKDADERLAEMLAENEQSGHAFKIKDDPRITRVGRFIRKYSIDELPQLVNVLKGDMSIVGPRPILQFQMEECPPHDRQRLAVQPGLTCYWQVSGRANIGWEDWVELDLDYIQDMSLATDARIIARTVPVVLSGDGGF